MSHRLQQADEQEVGTNTSLFSRVWDMIRGKVELPRAASMRCWTKVRGMMRNKYVWMRIDRLQAGLQRDLHYGYYYYQCGILVRACLGKHNAIVMHV